MWSLVVCILASASLTSKLYSVCLRGSIEVILPKNRKGNVGLQEPKFWVQTAASFLLTQTDSLTAQCLFRKRIWALSLPHSQFPHPGGTWINLQRKIESLIKLMLLEVTNAISNGLFLCAHIMQRSHVLCPGQRSEVCFCLCPHTRTFFQN